MRKKGTQGEKRHVLEIWRELLLPAYFQFLKKATEFFARISDAMTVEVSIKNLENEQDRIREKAAVRLGQIGAPGAVNALIHVLGDANPRVREKAAEALGKLKHPRAVEPLIKTFQDDTTLVRCKAAEALGKIGDARAVDALSEVFEKSDVEVRWEAERILGDRGGTQTIHMESKTIRKGNKTIRKCVAWALGEIGDSKAVEPLMIASGAEHSSVRWEAITALGKIRNFRSIEPLISVLKDKNASVRQEAIRLLGKFGDAKAVESVLPALNDPNPEIRGEAAEALGKIRDPRAVEPLAVSLEQDEDWYVRGEAAEALCRINDVRALEPLSKALVKDEHWFVRATAVRFLGKIGDIRCIKPLIETLSDDDKQIRIGATRALIRIGLAGKKPLVNALRHKNANIRLHVAMILGKIGWGPESLGQKLYYLAGRKKWNAIAHVGSPAIQPLKRLLRDRDAAVRNSAAATLKKIYASIDFVIFGQGKFNLKRGKTLHNFDAAEPVMPKPDYKQSLQIYPSEVLPDASEFTIPLSRLRRIVIQTGTYDFRLVERFITYAVNYLDRKHLKEQIEVHIYGDPEKLHPNLRNTFENLCKCVRVHKGDLDLKNT